MRLSNSLLLVAWNWCVLLVTSDATNCTCSTSVVYIAENHHILSVQPSTGCEKEITEAVLNQQPNCYITFDYQECNSSRIICERNVSSILRISSNKGHNRTLDTLEEKIGSAEIYANNFSITFKCSNEQCSLLPNANKSQLLINHGTYAEYLEKKKLLDRIVESAIRKDNMINALSKTKTNLPELEKSANKSQLLTNNDTYAERYKKKQLLKQNVESTTRKDKITHAPSEMTTKKENETKQITRRKSKNPPSTEESGLSTDIIVLLCVIAIVLLGASYVIFTIIRDKIKEKKRKKRAMRPLDPRKKPVTLRRIPPNERRKRNEPRAVENRGEPTPKRNKGAPSEPGAPDSHGKPRETGGAEHFIVNGEHGRPEDRGPPGEPVLCGNQGNKERNHIAAHDKKEEATNKAKSKELELLVAPAVIANADTGTLISNPSNQEKKLDSAMKVSTAMETSQEEQCF